MPTIFTSPSCLLVFFSFLLPWPQIEYPIVDGKLSNVCYLRALDNCYNRFAKRYEESTGRKFGVNEYDYAIFHQPYQKLVQKSWARYFFQDFLRNPTNPAYASFLPYKDLSIEQSYEHRDLEKVALDLSAKSYEEKVSPSVLLGTECGNMYCGR